VATAQQQRSVRPIRTSRFAGSWSEDALRRAGWAVWLTQLVVLVVSVAVLFVVPESATMSSWGSTGHLVDMAYILGGFSFPTVGLVIVHQQPRNRIGWLLLLAVGSATAVAGLLDTWAVYGLLIDPGGVPGAGVAAGLNEGSWVPPIGLLGIYLILLFPDGRVPSPRWRWLPWVAGAATLVTALTIAVMPTELAEGPIPDLQNPIGVESLETPLRVALGASLPLLPLCILAAAVAMVLRFRRSHGIERQQLKWLAAAAALVAVCYLAAMAGDMVTSTLVEGPPPEWIRFLQNIAVLSFIGLPVAIGAAILRHRLYDIDRLINRALVYGSLSLLLIGVYVGLVLGLRLLLDPFTGDSELAVAASTLAVAALFRPVRRRIQRGVDHRFYRQRYDATRTVESFAGRLRQEVDLVAVSDDLRSVVRETIQPAHVSVWLRDAP